MSAAAPTIKAGSSTRQLGTMALALLLAAAAFAVLAYGQFAASRQATAPATVTAPVVHDHGWSATSATVTAPVVHDRGWSSAAADSTKAWTVAPNSAAIDAARHRGNRSVKVTSDGIKVTGAKGGGLLYNGIPYAGSAAPADGGAGGSIRGRLAQ